MTYNPIEWLNFVNQVNNDEDIRYIVIADAERFKNQIEHYKDEASAYQTSIFSSDWEGAEAALRELLARGITRRMMWYGWQNLAKAAAEHVDIFNTVPPPGYTFRGSPMPVQAAEQQAFDGYIVNSQVPPPWSQRTASRARLIVQSLVYCDAREVHNVNEEGAVVNQSVHLNLRFAVKHIATNDYRAALQRLNAVKAAGLYGIKPEIELLESMIQLDA